MGAEVAEQVLPTCSGVYKFPGPKLLLDRSYARDDLAGPADHQPEVENREHLVVRGQGILVHRAAACRGSQGMVDHLAEGTASRRVVAWAYHQDLEGMVEDRHDRLLVGPVVLRQHSRQNTAI